MTEDNQILSSMRRKRLDYERYMRHHEERKAKNREYYRLHRETILYKKRCSLEMEYEKLKQKYIEELKKLKKGTIYE